MKIFLTLLALLFSSSCIKTEWRKNPHIEVKKLFLNHSQKAKIKQGIWLTGYGFQWSGKDHVYDGKVHLIDLDYSFNKRMKYEDAKKCFFSFVDELITYINEHEEFKDLFYHFPIGYEDFWLSFSFDDNSKGYLEKDDVWLITIHENEVSYIIVTDINKSNDQNPYFTRFSKEKLRTYSDKSVSLK